MRPTLPIILMVALTACTEQSPSAERGQTAPASAASTAPDTQPQNTAEPASANITDAMLQRRAEALRRQYADQGFTVVIEPPFVVIGDESPDAVRRRCEDTIRWAVDRLKADYFERDPEQLITIWLFKDRESYETHTRRIFNQSPHTPFGYYSSRHEALIMNIATGGGTLVHEIVHPFMAANFPACPPWFNEGLGSLYEQCRDDNGHIHGDTNWRLASLQRAIRDKRTVPFQTLCRMSASQFYDDDQGLHYAQARYLCYYLQQQGKLRSFYRAFRANQEDDPTGYQTLQDVLGREDMRAFEREWEQFVLALRFP